MLRYKKFTDFLVKKNLSSNSWFVLTIIAIIYAVIRLNIINIPLDRDEGGFGYIGQVILDGGMPYKHAFDHKPPLVFYINALALLFVPPSAAGIHIFLHIYNFLTLAFLYFLVRIYFKSSSVGFWTALVYALFSASPSLQGFTATTEMFMLLPIVLSLLFAVLAVRKQNVLIFLITF